ncbi:FemAB family protein [Hapalosiphon sp. MRB220]|nr:FemAB family protein [Hapalosiphon sp. MRB220]
MKHQIIDLSNPLWKQNLQELRHDVYHLPEYVYMESKRTNTIPEAILLTEGENKFFVPYLLRECNDIMFAEMVKPEIFDIVSPYGYPGILLSESAYLAPEFLKSAMNEFISTLRDKNICSAFLRLHPIFNEGLNEIYASNICYVTGETICVNLNLSHEEIWAQTRSDHRKDINRQKRSGLTARMVSFDKYFDEFIVIYNQTMERVGARQLYYFGREYFRYLLNNLGTKLHLGIVELENQITCACLFTECCGIVQSYLSGTKNEFLKLSPDKLLFDYVRYWAKERGNEVFHMGGGYGGTKDGVYNFKAGFSKERRTFLTLRLITDEEKYHHLIDLRAKYLNTDSETLLNSKFFPAYRSSNT